jgi:hypothetical protein
MVDILIILNIIVISTEYFNESEVSSKAHNILNTIFILIFTIEISLRLIAVGFQKFYKEFWNRFDMLVISGGIFEMTDINMPFNVTIFRLLRVTRILKVLYTSNDFKILIRTLIFSLPSLFNITALLILLIFIFAIIGMNLYGDANIDGEVFNDYQNFGHFGTSMLLLFRVTTGESWSAAMHILQDNNYYFTFLYFSSYLIFSNFVILNFYVAVILESYDNALHTEHNKAQKHNLEDFYHEWCLIQSELNIVPSSVDCLPSYCLVKLLNNLMTPLGLKDHPSVISITENDNSAFLIQYINNLMLKQGKSEC